MAAAVEPEPLNVTVRGAWPAAVDEETAAVGGVVITAGVTVTVVDAVLVWPAVLATVSTVEYVPALLNIWVTEFPVAVEPSPKFH